MTFLNLKSLPGWLSISVVQTTGDCDLILLLKWVEEQNDKRNRCSAEHRERDKSLFEHNKFLLVLKQLRLFNNLYFWHLFCSYCAQNQLRCVSSRAAFSADPVRLRCIDAKTQLVILHTREYRPADKTDIYKLHQVLLTEQPLLFLFLNR